MTARWTWRNGENPGLLQIDDITLTPDRPTPGNTINPTIRATAQDRIADGAYLGVVVKIGFIKVAQKSYDLFEKLEGRGDYDGWTLTRDTGSSGNSIEPGKVVLTFTMDLRRTPTSKYVVYVEGYTAEEDNLFDLRSEIDLLG